MDHLQSINKVYSLVVREESKNVVISTLVNVDDSSISINNYDLRRFQNRGKGSTSNGTNKNGSRYCTFCNHHNHTI